MKGFPQMAQIFAQISQILNEKDRPQPVLFWYLNFYYPFTASTLETLP